MKNIDQITGWLYRGMAQNCSHVIIAYDTLSDNNIPIYIASDVDILSAVDSVKKAQTFHVEEVYNLSLGLQTQLNVQKAYNI